MAIIHLLQACAHPALAAPRVLHMLCPLLGMLVPRLLDLIPQSFLVLNPGSMILIVKLNWASESPGVLVKTQIMGVSSQFLIQ